MKTIMRIALLLVAVVGFNFTNVFGQQTDAPKLYAVVFHADYCSACKAIGPTVMALKENLNDQEVEFVKIDLTSDESKSKSEKLAKNLGLSKIIESNKGTGYVVLVDAKTKEEKGVLTGKQSSEEMLATVDKLL